MEVSGENLDQLVDAMQSERNPYLLSLLLSFAHQIFTVAAVEKILQDDIACFREKVEAVVIVAFRDMTFDQIEELYNVSLDTGSRASLRFFDKILMARAEDDYNELSKLALCAQRIGLKASELATRWRLISLGFEGNGRVGMLKEHGPTASMARGLYRFAFLAKFLRLDDLNQENIDELNDFDLLILAKNFRDRKKKSGALILYKEVLKRDPENRSALRTLTNMKAKIIADIEKGDVRGCSLLDEIDRVLGKGIRKADEGPQWPNFTEVTFREFVDVWQERSKRWTGVNGSRLVPGKDRLVLKEFLQYCQGLVSDQEQIQFKAFLNCLGDMLVAVNAGTLEMDDLNRFFRLSRPSSFR